jgi:Cu(I)/Ag(I) efflux system membrane fusion protein
MKKRNLIIIIALGLLLVSGIFFYFLKSTSLKTFLQGKAVESAKSQSASEHKGHGEGQISQTVKEQSKEQKETEEAPTVEISPEKQQLIGVKTVEVSIKPFQKIIRTVGRIEYDERKLTTINTKIEGWIEKLFVDYTGRYVKKGEPLAEIYSPELYATQQEFINLLKWSSKSEIRNSKSEIEHMLSNDAEKLLEAARQRLRLWDITDDQIKKVEETKRPIRTLTLHSPVNGYVIQKTALQGMKVMPGEKLFDVADLSTVWIISDIYEYELPLIKVGETAVISLSYFPGKEFLSKIEYVYPSLSGETRTAKVRFTLSNPGGQLKPQMFTTVELKISLGKKLAIPDDAVIDTGTRQIVYVDKGEGYFEPREVMLGVRAEGLREVLMGLKAGEKVASSATFLIDSEAQLKGVKPLGGHKH